VCQLQSLCEKILLTSVLKYPGYQAAISYEHMNHFRVYLLYSNSEVSLEMPTERSLYLSPEQMTEL
jgi:hypothetical protein